MAYLRSNIVVRPTHSGLSGFVAELGGWAESLKSFVENTVTAFGETKKAQGAAQATLAQQQVVAPVDTGMSTSTKLALGAVGVGALVLVLKKRKKK